MNRISAKRLRKHMSEDEKREVKDRIEEELRGDIAKCTARVRSIGETGIEVKEELEDTASQIHNILKRALATALEQAKKDVTHTGMMKPGAGPKRRQVQEG